MRIDFITRNYPPTICGIGDHTYYLAREMKQQNHDIYIVCGADQKENFDDENTHPIVSEWNTKGVREVANLLNTLQIDWVRIFIIKIFPLVCPAHDVNVVVLSLHFFC